MSFLGFFRIIHVILLGVFLSREFFYYLLLFIKEEIA